MDDKNAKKGTVEKTTAGAATEAAKCKFSANWKIILGVLVVVIILLNTFWNMMETKISETVTKEIGSLKSELAKIDARISEAEKGTIDFDAVKKDVESIKKAGEDFEKKLASLIDAEKEKLARLEKDLENQKTYLDELKSLGGAAE